MIVIGKIKTPTGRYIEDLTGQKFGRLTVLKLTDKKSDNRWLWKCKCDCGNITKVSVGDLRRDLYTDLTRHGTYSCGCLSKSVGEKKVKTQLELLRIKFEREKSFEGCKNSKTNCRLRYDFYLPDYNCCIEYDGFAHFKASGGWSTEENLAGIQYRDNIKNKFCEDNNIRLVRIPYTDFNKIDTNYILDRIGDKIE